jgi:hypothetical protein
LGDNFYIGGYDLSGDINSLGNIGGGNSPLDVTGINKSAIERIGGLRDGRIEFVSYFNTASGQAHPRLKLLPTTDVHFMYCRGTTLGSAAACMIGKQTNYDGTRGDDGDFKFAVSAQANSYGLEWGNLLTAGIRNDSAAATGSSYDLGTGTVSFGAQAYLQVFGVTGTSVTARLQHSTDNVSFVDVTGGAFAAATGIGAERIATSATLDIDRYVRVATAGTFSAASFAVVIVRNQSATTF